MDPAQLTILVADDEFMIVDTLAEILDWQGYRVLTASNGREALDVLAREKPNLVLLDFMMPVMDGTEALAELRRRPEHASLPVIMMTAAMAVPPGERLWNALLRKPFGLPALEKAIADALTDAAK